MKQENNMKSKVLSRTKVSQDDWPKNKNKNFRKNMGSRLG